MQAKQTNKKQKTSILRSDLCDFSDAYIVVKETITFTETTRRSRKNLKAL